MTYLSIFNLSDADTFDVLRLGLVKTSTVCSNSRRRCCALCGGAEHGLTHILASCVQVWYERENFLHDAEWKASLAGALPGDWPAAVLSPHSGIVRLQQAVCYVAALVKKLESAARQR